MESVARFTLAALIAATLFGCKDRQLAGPDHPDGIGEPLMSKTEDVSVQPAHIVAPQLTDPEINVSLAEHYVWLPTSPGNPKLLVFMPGTANPPRLWTKLAGEAASLGYHVINLSYQNDVGVDRACKGSADPDCSGNMRLEIIDGLDRSVLINVTVANSIDNRLAKLLQYLDAQYPDEGWSRFLLNDEPKWSQIAVSGQSQGAGEAAMIGKIRHVNRVIMFSGPPDSRTPGEVDSWVAIGETPAEKYFALFHDQDNFLAGIRANLSALLGQYGEPVMAEGNEPPFSGAHVLFTDLEPQKGYAAPNPHQSTARDDNTPLELDGTTPKLRVAWRYLLGEPPRGEDQPNEP